MVVSITHELEMNSLELQSWTVLKKLKYKTLLKKNSLKLIWGLWEDKIAKRE